MSQTCGVQSAKRVLVVDDDKLDLEAFKRAVARVGATESLDLFTASNGQEAVDFLSNTESPELILVDLNMPVMNGFELMSWLRENNQFSKSVVFVLTSSDSDSDLRRAYDYRISGYLVKGSDHSKLSLMVEMLNRYLAVVEFPRAG